MSERNQTIEQIKANLKRRSGKAWSVKGGRGTAWGWIDITAPPRRCGELGYMSDDDRAELGELLGLGRPCHKQGEQVPAGLAYYREYVDRSAGPAGRPRNPLPRWAYETAREWRAWTENE